MKNKYKNYKSTPIYDLEYLQNSELTDTDLNNLVNGKSLNWSLIVAEFKLNGDKRNHKQILASCEKDDFWFDSNTWSLESQNNFRNILAKVYKNIYYYSEQRCFDMADMWLLNFGFRCIHE